MSIREFYEQLGEDYDEVLRRMMGKESFAAMLLRSFLQDQTYGNLSQAMHGGSTEDIFEQSHTLKGVAANLGLKPLYDKTAVLVELTRAGILEGADEAFAGIKKEYETILGLLEQIEFAEGV